MSRAWSYRVRVRLVRERAHRFGPAFRCASDVAEALGEELVGLDREQFLRCHLDVKNRVPRIGPPAWSLSGASLGLAGR